jgi:hypothetical protein
LNEYGIGLVGDKKQAIPIYKNLFWVVSMWKGMVWLVWPWRTTGGEIISKRQYEVR